MGNISVVMADVASVTMTSRLMLKLFILKRVCFNFCFVMIEVSLLPTCFLTRCAISASWRFDIPSVRCSFALNSTLIPENALLTVTLPSGIDSLMGLYTCLCVLSQSLVLHSTAASPLSLPQSGGGAGAGAEGSGEGGGGVGAGNTTNPTS